MKDQYSRLPFAEALAFFAQKLNLDTDSWRDGQGIVQDAAFTVAAAKGQLLQEIREAVDHAISEGKSVDAFMQDFDRVADRWVDNWTLRGDRAWRGQLIYEQNLRQAYAAGRYAQMTDPDVLRDRPWWEWRHGGSRSPRLAHLAMDRRVFPAGSIPIPPWGFGCQCTVFSLSQRDLDRLGITPEPEWTPTASVDFTDPATGKTEKVSLRPDPGFEHSPGESSAERRQRALEQALRRLEPRIAAQVRREIEDRGGSSG